MTLQDIEWQTDNTYNADDYEIGDRFTAICTGVPIPPEDTPSKLPGTGTAITPQVSSGGGTTISSGAGIYGASGGSVSSAGSFSGGAGGSTAGVSNDNYYPPAQLDGAGSAELTVTSSNKFTLPDGMFYSDGSLGRLKIPKLDLNVKVYEDESLESGAGQRDGFLPPGTVQRKPDYAGDLCSGRARDALVCPGPGSQISFCCKAGRLSV